MNTPTSHAKSHERMAALLNPPSRRQFLKTASAGLMIWVLGRPALSAEESEAARPLRRKHSISKDFNAFLSIAADGRVCCFTGKIEMGQGPITSLPQTLAEELDVPVDNVDIIMGDTELCPFDQGTWGSMTTRFFGPLMRSAAAEARAVLLDLGAAHLKTPIENLQTCEGFVLVKDKPQLKVSYGTLTGGKRIERHLEVRPDLKKPENFKIVGKPLLRRDSREKVTGTALYSGDLRLPGMLCARLLRPPAQGARIKNLDTSGVASVPGAHIIETGGLVAVLHASPELAEEALALIKAEYESSASKLNDQNIYAHLALAPAPIRTTASEGSLEQGLKSSKATLKSVYKNAYVAHAAMETHTALAKVENDKATVWASTQNPFGVRDEVAATLGLPVEAVRVITPFVGGGFGGKAMNQQAVEAALLAKASGKPVQVMWTREEEFFLDHFRPAAVVNIAAGLDENNSLNLWDYEVRFADTRGSDLLYAVPHHRIQGVGTFQGPREVHPFPVGAWRAPGCNTNAFARESHISRLAELAQEDPIAFRLRHLTHNPRAHRVLTEAAARWHWTAQRERSGRGLGVALGFDAGTYVATIAKVSVARDTGKIKVEKILCVQEMGLVINPAGAKQQMEGCIAMGLGYALSEEIHFEGGAIHDLNFDTYQLPRFSWMPEMETHILEADNTPPQGGGEPAIIVMGAVLANAVYDACGARLEELPMTPERVLASLPPS